MYVIRYVSHYVDSDPYTQPPVPHTCAGMKCRGSPRAGTFEDITSCTEAGGYALLKNQGGRSKKDLCGRTRVAQAARMNLWCFVSAEALIKHTGMVLLLEGKC